MSGRGDQEIEVAIERRLDRSPADVLDLLETIRRRRAAIAKNQEGALHGLLHAALRAGTIVVVGRSPRGLALYAPAGTDPLREAEEPPLPEPLSPAVSKTALKVARPVRDEADRGRVIGDLVAHLSELEAKEDPKAFGSPRLARQLLNRADRGKWAVFFTSSGADRARRIALHEGPWIACAVVLFFVLRAFVGEVFQIPSESMRPTLEPGDRVVVSKLGGDLPDRWSVVVFRHFSRMRGREIAVVKRMVGLPGEEIAIFQGDVFVDGQLLTKPDDIRAALRFPRMRWQPRGGTFVDWDKNESHDEVGWALRRWPLDGDVFYSDEVKAIVSTPMQLFDGYLRVDADIAEGTAATVTLSRGRLTDPKPPDAVEWTLRVEPAATRIVELRPDGATTLADVPIGPGAGAVTLELSYVDGVLRASFGTEDGSWRWHQGDGVVRPAPYHPLALRVGTVGAATLRSIVLDQDVHYSHDHHHGVPSGLDVEAGRMNPHRIPEGHVFFLGDNTRDSSDSRHAETGDIPVESVVGPVTFRIWPIWRIGTID